MVDSVHKYILGSIKPDLTFILKANISKAMQRLKKRKKKKKQKVLLQKLEKKLKVFFHKDYL